MDDSAGSELLEKLAELNLLDDFMEAVDADDFDSINSILETAGIDEETISAVIQKIKS